MKKHKLLSGLLALALTLGLTAPALAAEEVRVQAPSVWAVEALAESYALGLVDDNYSLYIEDTITQEALAAMTAIVADKLALLKLPVNTQPAEELVIDSTRSGVINALYQEAAAYALPGIESAPADYLVGLGVIKGGQNGDLMLDRSCSYQEAMVMARRLILAIYDANDAGSKGFLWKAVNGSNTLYLLGTIHVDRSNVYPFHKSLRQAIQASKEVIFEVDFSDAKGMEEYAAMQVYSDGTSLKDHIPADLYADTVALLAPIGVDEATVNIIKPWVLALTLNSLLMTNEGTGSNAVAIDLHITALAINAGKKIGAVETLAFQGAIFDSLSEEEQIEGLKAAVALVKSNQSGEKPTDEEAQALQDELKAQSELLDVWMEAWKKRDPQAFEASYDKKAALESGDEMSVRLFTDRDPNMIKAAARYLETEGENTFFLAVGAGHMIDPGGIISGLRELGYTVELVK